MLRRLLLFLIPIALHADALQDAAQALAGKIASQLRPGETPRLTAQNLSSLSDAQVSKLQSEVQGDIQRSLHKTARRRLNVPVALTISENVSGYLLVAEIRARDRTATEMVSFEFDPPSNAPPLLTIAKRLLWQQELPILDLAIVENEMLVLEPERIVKYERTDNKWIETQSASLTAPVLRDPRGHLQIEQSDLTVFLPTATCRGTWQPSLSLACEPGVSNFALGSELVHFALGRNTIEGAPGVNSDAVGDEVPACGGKILASGRAGRDAEDIVTLFDGSAPASEALPVPGPVTALWPRMEGALAVVFDLAKKQYAAYALSVDCSQ